jgi:hypothetical protein
MTKNTETEKDIPVPKQRFSDPILLDGELMDIEKHNEQWSEFTLKDGATIRIKPVVIEIRKLRNQFNQSGEPVYLVKSAVVTDAKVPDSLRKKR